MLALRRAALVAEDALYNGANRALAKVNARVRRYWLSYAIVSPVVIPMAIVAATIGVVFHTAPIRAEKE